jgi:alanyl-tRNA synthetase
MPNPAVRWATPAREDRDGAATITDTKKVAGVFVHIAEVTEGDIAPGQPAVLEVDHARRGTIRANHSATHLLARGAAPRAWRSRGAARLAERAGPAAVRLQPWQGVEHGRNFAQVEREVNDFIRQNAPSRRGS